MNPELYLDNAATTAPYPEAIEAALPWLRDHYANPSSLHGKGMEVHRAIKGARETLARLLNVPALGVTFTSGGTESDNLALKGVFASRALKGERLLISAIEHPAVRDTAEWLASQGVRVEILPVTQGGVVDLAACERMLDSEVRMVSIMAVNNEVGTAQPLRELGRLIERNAPRAVFHVDAVQAFTKRPLPWREAGIHLLSLSAHKVHGPMGVGALVRCKPIRLEPLIHGGGQEEGLRSGTENPFGVVAFAEAAKRATTQHAAQSAERAAMHRQWLGLLAEYPRVQVYRSEAETPFIIQASLSPIPGEVVLHHLEDEGLLVSTGSACSSHRSEPSPVLLALGMDEQQALSSIRLSFSVFNTPAGWDEASGAFRRAMERLNKL